jgi:hypothetical protein
MPGSSGDFIRAHGAGVPAPTISQLDTGAAGLGRSGQRRAKTATAAHSDHRARPADVIVEDNVGFPALVTAGVPFVTSCRATHWRLDPQIPPAFFRLPSADPVYWQAFPREYERVHRPLWADFNEWVTS